MPQSLVQLYVHIVFSTSGRRPYFRDEELRNRCHAYLAGAFKNQHAPALIVGGADDHIHALCRLGSTLDVASLVREVKRESSKWAKQQSTALGEFAWQGGYGAFSVSPSHVAALTKYIQGQTEHHRRESFQDEFRRLCAKYGVELDERYVWD